MNANLVSEILFLASFAILCYIIGRSFLGLFKRQSQEFSQPIYGAVAPVIGIILVGIQLWLFGIAHIPWNKLIVFLPWILILAIFWANISKHIRSDIKTLSTCVKKIPDLSLLEKTLLTILLICFGVILLQSITSPVLGWDAIAMWLYKAKLYFSNGAVGFQTIGSVQYPASDNVLLGSTARELVRHQDYPPIYSLMIDSLYVWRGGIDEAIGKSLNIVFLFSFLATFYTVLRKFVSTQYLLILLFCFVTLPLAKSVLYIPINLAYADYTVGILMGLSACFLVYGIANKSVTGLLTALLLGFGAALTKNDGQPFFAALVVIIAGYLVWLYRKHLVSKKQVVVCIGAMVGVVVWLGVWKYIALKNGFVEPSNQAQGVTIAFAITRLREIMHYGYRFMALHAGLLVVSLLLAGIVAVITRFRLLWAVLALLFVQVVSYLAVYITTSHDLAWLLSTTFDRLMLQLAPLEFLAIGLALAALHTSQKVTKSV